MLDRITKPLVLAGVSAGLMYLFDPDRGRRRRSLLRDKAIHAKKTIFKAADVSVRDTEHRLYGNFCELRAKLRGRDTSDGVVVDRVRSKIGRCTAHPSSIEVHVRNGCVTLSGPILAGEVANLVATVRAVDGVRSIENLLDIHESPADVSGLQECSRHTGDTAERIQANWTPTARLIVGAT